MPSQVVAGVRAPAEQLAPLQPVLVDQARQAPAPSQVPSLEQSPADTLLATQRPLGSALPEPTGKQVPALPASLQLLHSPAEASSLHALSQHTPSVQKPLTHWLPVVQAVPTGFKPQELPTQVVGGTQSASEAQVALQAAELQMKVPQETLAGVLHVPAPSQVDTGVSEDVEAQSAGLQLSPLAK